MIEGDEELLAARVIVVHGEDWHKGVLGIAASKIADNSTLRLVPKCTREW